MPKLSDHDAREAEKAAEEGGPEPLPAGIYVGRLFEVEVSDKAGDSGYHYWTWKYKIEDEGYKGREQRHITSLSPKAAFSIGGAFAAFGVPADTHTDELLGQRVLLQVTRAPIAKGTRAGEIGNTVQYTMPYDPEKNATPLDDVGGSVARDEDF